MADKSNQFNHSLKLIANSSLIILIGIILSKLFTYAYRIIIVRELGLDVYGLFSLSVMVVGWFILLSSIGLTEGLLRYFSIYRGKGQINKIRFSLKYSIYLLLITSLFAGAILFIFAPFIANNIFKDSNLVIFLRFFAATIPLTIFLSILYTIFRAYERVGWQSFFVNILSPGFSVTFLLIFLFIGLKSRAVIFSYVLESFLIFILTFLICKKMFPGLFKKYKLTKKIKSKTITEIFVYSFPLFFAGFLWKIFYWADSFFIGYFFTAKDVGLYNTAVPIALLLTLSSQLFMQLFFPLVTKEFAKGNTEMINQLSKQIEKWILAVNLPAFILLIIFPESVLSILFGSESVSVAGALRFLAVGVLFLSLTETNFRLITMRAKSKIIFFDFLFVALLNIFLNFFMVPKYGLIGAAISTMTSSIILSGLFILHSFQVTSVLPLRRKMLNIILAAIISTTFLVYLKNLIEPNTFSVVILAASFLSFYILLVLLFRGLDKNDFMILENFKNVMLKRRIKENFKII